MPENFDCLVALLRKRENDGKKTYMPEVMSVYGHDTFEEAKNHGYLTTCGDEVLLTGAGYSYGDGQ